MLAVAIISGGAFSAWYLSFKVSGSSSIATDVDKIAENYSFNEGAKKHVLERYTIYLFPSTIYLDAYLDYLDGKAEYKPEELYGYISPLLNEDGTPALSQSGDVTYSVSAKNQGDDGYLTEWVDSDTGKYRDEYVGGESNSTIKTFYDMTGYDYGDPDRDGSEWNSGYGSYDSEQHNYRNLHRYDRFGYWPYVKKDEGRYLPLKIEVDQNFSSNFYEQVVKRPLSDMGDSHAWFCYSFTLWSYVSHKNADGAKNYKAPYYATDEFISNLSADDNKSLYGQNGSVKPELSAFCPTAVSQYFDLMGDMSVYADDDGIIRLFPKFSNGKTYNETSSDASSQSGLPKGFLNGGSDAVRMTPTYAEGKNALAQHDFYLSYTSEYVEYNGVSGTAVAMLPNVALADFENLTIQMASNSSTGGFATWPGGWKNLCAIENDRMTELIKLYGEGFYNLYVFIGCVGLAEIATETTNHFANLTSVISGGSRTDDGIFNSLRGKNLQLLDCNYVSSSTGKGKPVCIAIEKVRDTRVVMNIKRKNATQSEIQSGYELTNQYFKYLSKDVYVVSSGVADKIDISNSTPINRKYQYCYMLSGVDFTNANTPDFQVRFQKRYRSDLVFHGVDGVYDGGGDGDYTPDVDLIFNPAQDGSFEKEQRFICAFGNYFNVETKTVINDIDGDSAEEEQIVFSLINEEYKGIYDLLIIYIPNEYYTVTEDGKTVIKYEKPSYGDFITHSAGFYMFAYRQTNVFLKVLANDLKTHDGDGFVKHLGNFGEPNMLIFQKEYALGVSLKGGDTNEESPLYTSEYSGYFKPAVGQTLASCLNTYVAQFISDKGLTVDRIVIRDHVTGAIVAKYKKLEGTEMAIEAYTDKDGDRWGLVFEDFRVTKNYIFYVTYII